MATGEEPASSPTDRGVRVGVRVGAADAWPVALGMVPLGLAFGLLITQLGFSWWWAPVFSIVIYAGSMEFLALTLVTGGAAPASAGLYALLVNFRHIFYALNYPISKVRGWAAKAYGVYALTDETYAIISANREASWTTARVMTVQVLLQCGWVGGGILGALFGAQLPFQIQGMEFALTALFTVLMIESFAAHKDLSLPLTALLAAGIGLLISPDNVLMIAMSIYFVVLIARHILPRLDAAMSWFIFGATPPHRLTPLPSPGGEER